MNFLERWVNAMPNTIIGLCTVAIITMALGIVGMAMDSTALFVAAGVFGQVGTVLALVLGFLLDRQRRGR